MFEITVTGNLARDPVVKEVNGKDGPTKVCNLVVASNDRKTDETTYVSVALWGKRAEVLAPMLCKGTKVFARGDGDMEVFENKAGKHVAAPKIKSASVFEAMGNLKPKDQSTSGGSSKPSMDDIPF